MPPTGQAPRSSRLRLDFVVCDVFSSRPLAGNALAVFPAGAGLDADLRQRLARELNLSETVFVSPAEDGGDARLQIHTPEKELPFAGHPILGTAAVLAAGRDLDLRLETGVGIVPVGVRTRGERAAAWMTQPWPRAVEVDPAPILAALRIGGELPVVAYDNGARFAFVELPGAEDVAGLRPDLALLTDLGHGVLCFARSGAAWRARMFGPALGVPEDPATGSAAGPLAVHLNSQGRVAGGETIRIEQGIELARPSLLEAVVEDVGGEGNRVRVGGDVVVVAKGSFELPSDRSAK